MEIQHLPVRALEVRALGGINAANSSSGVILYDSCTAFSMYRQVTTGVIEFIVIRGYQLYHTPHNTDKRTEQ